MYSSKITGLGYYVPENVVTNNDLKEFSGWRLLMNGFKNEQE